MKVKLVSFDAAETLLRVRWSPGQFAVERAQEIGITLDPQLASELYERLLYSRWGHYQTLNRIEGEEDNSVRCDEFWCELTHDWLTRMSVKGDARALVAHANERMYAPDSPVYSVFEDVLDTLAALRAARIPMIVLSNWDYSLHRAMKAFGLTSWFDYVFASLEFGPEKPELELFRIVERATGFSGDEILHVGDNPIDDLHGALNAGWRAALIDRNPDMTPSAGRIARLTEVPGLL